MAAPRMGPIARGTLISFVIRLTALGAGFTQAVLTARLLGPEGYGVIAVAVSVVMVAAMLSALGLGSLAVREVAQLAARADWSRLRGFLQFSVGSVLAASVVAGFGVAALAQWTGVFDEPFRDSIALAGLMVPAMAFLTLLRGVAQGFGWVVMAQAPGEVLRPVTMVILLGTLALTGISLNTSTYIALAAAIAAMAATTAAIGLWTGIDPTVRAVQPRVELPVWSRAAAPFLGMTAVTMLHGELNTLMLGWLANPAEVGLFQPILRLVPLMIIGMQSVAVRYAPRISELWISDDMASLVRISRLVTLTTTLATVASCATILTAAPWLLAAFGEQFTASNPALWWIAAAHLFGAACGPVGFLLTMTGHTYRALGGQLVALVTNLSLGLWLIPQMGGHGAALAMAGGLVASNILMLIFVHRTLLFDPTFFGALIALGSRQTDSQSGRSGLK